MHRGKVDPGVSELSWDHVNRPLLLSSKTLGVVGAILIGEVILIICVSNFRNRRD